MKNKNMQTMVTKYYQGFISFWGQSNTIQPCDLNYCIVGLTFSFPEIISKYKGSNVSIE